MDVQPEDGGRMRELALFAGAGGGILGGTLLGWRTVCAVELDKYAASVLVARQNDGFLPTFPIWDDVCTFDGRPWKGRVDVVSGGFPCQDVSSAGRGAGVQRGTKSGLWKQMARVVGEVRPQYVFVENSPLLASRGLSVVVGDLSEMGYDAQWGIVSAQEAGAPHRRERIWIAARNMADAKSVFCNGGKNLSSVGMGKQSISKSGDGCWTQDVADSGHGSGKTKQGRSIRKKEKRKGKARADASGGRGDSGSDKEQSAGKERFTGDAGWWISEPGVGRVADGVAARVDRLKAVGNGQVPAVAALAWRSMTLVNAVD